MKRSRFSDEQIIGILKENEAGVGVPVKDLCRKHGMSDATYLEVNEARRLRDLEDENRRLKKRVAELLLDKMALEDVLKNLSPEDKRKAVKLLKEFGSSERRCHASSTHFSPQRQ